MLKLNRLLMLLLIIFGTLLFAGCSSTGSGYGSSHVSVYGGYGYSSYRYGYPGYHPSRPDRPDRPDRPKPVHPIEPGRPSIQPISKPSGGMGRPARASGGRRR